MSEPRKPNPNDVYSDDGVFIGTIEPNGAPFPIM